MEPEVATTAAMKTICGGQQKICMSMLVSKYIS